MLLKSTVICVLGMHRSGTSCLAGTLEHHGVHFGDVQQQNRYNPKGNRENIQFNTLNEMILEESGGSWDDPPSTIRWTESHAEQRDRLIQEFLPETPGSWGFKDPRLTFTLPFWREAMPDLRPVASFRHPQLVAESLARRNEFPIAQGLSIWLRYNQRLLEHLNETPFPLISFDAPDGEYRNGLQALSRSLGLHQEQRKEDFFDPALRHHRLADNQLAKLELPTPIMTLYRTLQNRHRQTLTGFVE